MKPDLLHRVENEIVNGRAWRAKEILRSTFPKEFDPEHCEVYGRVLLQMDDLYEAGRYLFVSGGRNPEYQPAIEVFIERFLELKMKKRWAVLPGRIHHVVTQDWPATTVDDLKRLGVYEEVSDYQKVHARPSTFLCRIRDYLIPIGCMALMVLILLLAIVGFMVVLGFILGFSWY